jgi:hypothetical protein
MTKLIKALSAGFALLGGLAHAHVSRRASRTVEPLLNGGRGLSAT